MRRGATNFTAGSALLILVAVAVLRANSRSVVGPAGEGYPKSYVFGREAGPVARWFLFDAGPLPGPPAALLFDVSLVVMLVWLVSALLARRAAQTRTARGLCPACGYDLRASPDRCPECGAAATRVDAG